MKLYNMEQCSGMDKVVRVRTVSLSTTRGVIFHAADEPWLIVPHSVDSNETFRKNLRVYKLLAKAPQSDRGM